VTAIRGLPGTGADLDSLVTELKRLCGAGGTLRDGVVEIQGDHRERIAETLRTRGYRVKLAGG
jgi:translation initiation factor 1